MLATLRELGIGVVAYSPLGRGFLSGRITSPDDFGEDDFRRNHPRFSGENFARNLELVERVKQLAAGKAAEAQLAIAWVLAQGDDVPIPGPSGAATWRRTPAPSRSSSPERTWPPSRRSRPAGRPPGRATPPAHGQRRRLRAAQATAQAGGAEGEDHRGKDPAAAAGPCRCSCSSPPWPWSAAAPPTRCGRRHGRDPGGTAAPGPLTGRP